MKHSVRSAPELRQLVSRSRRRRRIALEPCEESAHSPALGPRKQIEEKCTRSAEYVVELIYIEWAGVDSLPMKGRDMQDRRYEIGRPTPDGLQSADGAPRFAALVVVDTHDRDAIVARGRMTECWEAAWWWNNDGGWA